MVTHERTCTVGSTWEAMPLKETTIETQVTKKLFGILLISRKRSVLLKKMVKKETNKKQTSHF